MTYCHMSYTIVPSHTPIQPIHLYPSLFLSFSASLGSGQTPRLPAPSKAPEELQRVAPTVEALEVEALQGLVLAGAGRGSDLPQI